MKDGAKVETFGSCGMPAGAWVTPRPVACGVAQRVGNGPVQENRTPKAMSWSIDALIDRYKPNVVVVGIGDPMAGYNQKDMQQPLDQAERRSADRAHRSASPPCVWIGPGWGKEGGPYSKTFARVKEFSEYMATIVAPCAYVDSLPWPSRASGRPSTASTIRPKAIGSGARR